MLAIRKTPSANGCKGVSTSLSSNIVIGVKQRLSAVTTINKTVRKTISFVLQSLLHAPKLASGAPNVLFTLTTQVQLKNELKFPLIHPAKHGDA